MHLRFGAFASSVQTSSPASGSVPDDVLHRTLSERPWPKEFSEVTPTPSNQIPSRILQLSDMRCNALLEVNLQAYLFKEGRRLKRLKPWATGFLCRWTSRSLLDVRSLSQATPWCLCQAITPPHLLQMMVLSCSTHQDLDVLLTRILRAEQNLSYGLLDHADTVARQSWVTRCLNGLSSLCLVTNRKEMESILCLNNHIW